MSFYPFVLMVAQRSTDVKICCFVMSSVETRGDFAQQCETPGCRAQRFIQRRLPLVDNYVKLSRYDSKFDTTISKATSGVNSTSPLFAHSISQFHIYIYTPVLANRGKRGAAVMQTAFSATVLPDEDQCQEVRQ
jgi:hypothetical protein